MPMIFVQIHSGMSAEEIGLAPENYNFRKELLERFEAQYDGSADFVDSYLAWLLTQPEGQPFKAPVSSGPKHDVQEAAPVATKKQIRPSFVELAKSATSAIKTIALSGVETVSAEDRERRLEICAEPCDHLDDGSRCVHIELEDGTIEKGCGCYMPIKSYFTSMKCPIGKW